MKITRLGFISFLSVISCATNILGLPDNVKVFKIDKRYLNLPVRNDIERQQVKVIIDNRDIRHFDIRLAPDNPDYWVFVDLKDFIGKTALLKLEKSIGNGIEQLYLDNRFAGQDSLYRERLRPQIHFTSKRGWNNDPNGLVYHAGEYHLFYQHNPYGVKWGNMHWGHAISQDLVHWQELPTAIYPMTYGDMAYSGSAVVDKLNTAGFKKENRDVLVAAYTSTGRGECLAISYNNGRTFEQYEGNPVVKHDGRDPKVFWYGPGKHWVMVLYDQSLKQEHGVDVRQRALQIYTSDDLKIWTYRSMVPDFYECPELFELAVDGDKNKRKWVMYGGNGQYLIGGFDGKVFTPEIPRRRFHYGNFYASQTYNNVPDGRRIQIGWGRGVEAPGMPFNQLMLFPTELSLRTTGDGIRLFAKPVSELSGLHSREHNWQDILLSPEDTFTALFETGLLHIKAEFEVLDAFQFGMTICGFNIKYDAQNFMLNDVYLRPDDGKITLEVIVDRTSLEIFGNDGRVYIPKAYISAGKKNELRVYSGNPTSWLSSLQVFELKSIWH